MNLRNKFIKTIANILFKNEYKRFISALQDPLHSQKQVRERLSKKLNKKSLKNDHEFHDYDELHSQFKNQKIGETFNLYPSEIIHFEYTSGSQSIRKKIPYTKDLMKVFHKMFSIWCYDLIQNGPKFELKKFFFSISYETQEESTIKDDSDYLSLIQKNILKYTFIDSSVLKSITNSNDYYYELSKILLKQQNLEVISVWNPQVLVMLLKFVKNNYEKFNDLRPDLSSSDIKNAKWTKVWPKLLLISCWGDALSARSFSLLEKSFPGVLIQKKGLLATETPISVPLIGQKGHLPLIHLCYFHFLDDMNNLVTIDNLKLNTTYEILTSTPGGFQNYRIGDLVKVIDYYYQCPVFEFVGKINKISDICGEKLHLDFLNNLIKSLNPNFEYYFCSYQQIDQHEIKNGYKLVTNNEDEQLCTLVEMKLTESFHYNLCRNQNILSHVQIITTQTPFGLITDELIKQRNMKRGDIKESTLYRLLNV